MGVETIIKDLENLKVEKRVLENRKKETVEQLKSYGIDTTDIQTIEKELNTLTNESERLSQELNDLLLETEAKLLEIKEKIGMQ